MTVHAFVDESERPRVYLLCVALVDPGQLAPTRRELRRLLLPGQRELHFHNEKPDRRRMLADRIANLPVAVHIYRAAVPNGAQELARQCCVHRLVKDLLVARAHRLVIDSREEQDRHDKVTIHRVLGRRPSTSELAFEHLNSASVPLLWIPDAVAWCYGAGGDWRRRVLPIIGDVIDINEAQSP